jgi:hypothetical protein
MRVPLSTQSIDRYELSEKDLMQLNYYVSDDLVLYNIDKPGDPVAYKGNLFRLKNTETPKTTYLKHGTSGVARSVLSDRLVVSFELGPRRNMVFGSEDQSGLYKLMAKQWIDGYGMVDYGKTEHYTLPGSSGTFVYFKLRELKQSRRRSHKITGRKF